jgi:amino acid transporter
MAARTDERAMISERIAPGMLPRVLGSFDMTIIFVAIVLFIVNASAIQQAHQAAFTYWILGFLAFLIPGALVTAQLGQMFPQEGPLYVWTQKALSRLLFVSGLEQRMPRQLGQVNDRTKVPVYAILTQTVLSSLFVIAIFNPWVSGDNNQKAYWLFQAAVTVIWCISMVLLFADIFLVKRAFPQKFEEVRAAHPYLLYASGAIGMLASAFGAYVVFRSPWTGLFSVGHWRIWLGALCGISVLAAILIYVISEYVHRREMPTAAPTPTG